MFTLEIGGKAVAVTDADEDEARALMESEEFKADLKALEGEDGTPLWDGRAALRVRAASEDEISEFEDASEPSEGDLGDNDNDDDDEDGPLIVFLVPISAEDDEDGA